MTEPQKILLVVDAQEGFRNLHTEKVIPKILAALQASADLVVFTRFINSEGSNFERLLNWPNMKSGEATEILLELSKFANQAIVFEKPGYSAFSSLQFSNYLQEVGAESIDICGFDTDACVLATALDAFDAGYRPRILVEACASSGGAPLHNNSIEILQRNLGVDAIVRGV